MIRELLELLFVRQLSYGEIEGELGIDHTTLQSRIEMLVHMGYLKRTTMSMEGCDGACLGCAKHTIVECHEEGTDEGEGGTEEGERKGRSLSGYELTEKGKRVLER